jgi:hypothetical protein
MPIEVDGGAGECLWEFGTSRSDAEVFGDARAGWRFTMITC